MSTLNSSQLYVKRSSTRLHAPPGGHSSLSFGSGGFGTTDAEPAGPPPSSAGSFRGGTSSGYGAFHHPVNNQGVDGGRYANAPPVFHSIKGSHPAQQQPQYPSPPSSYGYHAGGGSGGGYPSSAQQPATPAMGYEGLGGAGRPASTQSNYSWGDQGSQPPLTSSKRDQNWEKKRRLWLARKNAGSSGSQQYPATPGTSSSSAAYHHLPLPPPPSTAYGGAGGGYYEHDPGAYNPPSPLTKFMAQQTHSKPFAPPEASGGYDSSYGPGPARPPSSSSSGVAGSGGYPPPRTAAYRDDLAPPGTAYSAMGSSHGNRHLASSAGYGGYGANCAPPPQTGGAGGGASTGGGPMFAPPRTSSVPGTASSVSSTSSSRRQPPGGSSNWSPYS